MFCRVSNWQRILVFLQKHIYAQVFDFHFSDDWTAFFVFLILSIISSNIGISPKTNLMTLYWKYIFEEIWQWYLWNIPFYHWSIYILNFCFYHHQTMNKILLRNINPHVLTLHFFAILSRVIFITGLLFVTRFFFIIVISCLWGIFHVMSFIGVLSSYLV